jgi:hypothetical protein
VGTNVSDERSAFVSKAEGGVSKCLRVIATDFQMDPPSQPRRPPSILTQP